MGVIKKYHKENENEWKIFLRAVGETPKKDKVTLTFVADMDTEEILEKGEILRFFQQRRYKPHLEAPLREALDGLPLKQMAVLHGIFWRSLTEKEVAREMNCTVNSVRILKSKGIKFLRKALINRKGGEILKMPQKASFT